MRSLVFSAALAVVAGVSALPQHGNSSAPPFSPEFIASAPVFPVLTPEQIDEKYKDAKKTTDLPPDNLMTFGPSAGPSCANLRERTEWDHYSNDDRQAFVTAVQCLMNKPSQTFQGQATTRYDDLIVTHQSLNANIHGNNKFLLWHRYFLWTFEDMLRQECGFTASMPWLDETKWAGNLPGSSVFTNDWFGSVDLQGGCVQDGQFAGFQYDIGGNTNCLRRNYNSVVSGYVTQDQVGNCNNDTEFTDMAPCAEDVHGNGHVAIGGSMGYIPTAPSDPVFWLHHAFVDHNYRVWQNVDEARVNEISGTDHVGNPLTLDTMVSVANLRNSVSIGDILDTTGETLCYKYSPY